MRFSGFLSRELMVLFLLALLVPTLGACVFTEKKVEEPVPAPAPQAQPAPTPPPPPPPAVQTRTVITARVTAYRLNVRQGPGGSHRIVGGLKQDDRVEVQDYSGDWYRILTPDQTNGWVSGKYLSDFMEVQRPMPNQPAPAPSMAPSPAPSPAPTPQEPVLDADSIGKALEKQ